jgi:hypothetical protein
MNSTAGGIQRPGLWGWRRWSGVIAAGFNVALDQF